jgi:hypothetical protein
MKSILGISIFLIFLLNSSAQRVINTNGGANNGAAVVERKTKLKVRELKVLFTGDLYTEANSLTQIVQYMSAQLRTPVKMTAAKLTAQGMTFADHLKNPSLKEALTKHKWDYIVFQDLASKPLTDPESTIKDGAALAKLVRDHGSEPMFFMTWPDNGKPETLKEIFNVYKKLAIENKALMAPVGTAWSISLKKYPKMSLYLKDSSYPSPYGTYLTAAVLATTLTRQAVTGQKNTGFKSVSLAEAQALQKVAYKIVVDYGKHIKKARAAALAEKNK